MFHPRSYREVGSELPIAQEVKLERLMLRVFLSEPSTNLQARADDQLRLRVIGGDTRLWLMVSATDAPGGTRLYFGSALLPGRKTGNASTGKPTMAFVFKALLSFHNLYSRALLSAAARRLA